MVFAGIYIADKKKLARIQLVSKNVQLGSARFQKPASSAQLSKFQLGSARLSSPISSSVASLINSMFFNYKKIQRNLKLKLEIHVFDSRLLEPKHLKEDEFSQELHDGFLIFFGGNDVDYTPTWSQLSKLIYHLKEELF